jgi:exosortase/archaeosortase family protein
LRRTSKQIVQFGWRAIALLVGWVILDQWLMRPAQVTEVWIAPQMAAITSGILELFYPRVWLHGPILGIETAAGIHIVEGCVGLNYYAMFLGFLFAFPYRVSLAHQFSFALFGIGAIYLINIVRMTSLAAIQYHWPTWLVSVHYWTGSYLFFSLILLLWMIYVQDMPVEGEAEIK